MAGRRGALRGGRLRHNDVDSFVLGRDQRVALSTSRGVSQELDENFRLGFGGGAEVGGGEGSRSEANRGCGGRNGVARAAIGGGAASAVGVARGRGGRGGASAIVRGRGGRGGATEVVRGRGGRSRAARAAGGVGSSCEVGATEANGSDSGRGASRPVPIANSTGAGRGRATSTSASEQEDCLRERGGRGGRSRGRSSASQRRRTEELSEVDEDLEGDQREKGGKGKNFKPEEERQLTLSVLTISQDPIVGNGQKGSAFWERIFQHYDDRRPHNFRPARSLESKWGLIKHDVAKYIGVLQQCSNLNVSGANAANVQKKALELYRLKTPKNTEFAYLHVWEIVKEVPRWNLGCTLEKTAAPVMKRKEVSCDSDCTILQPSSSTDGEGGSASTFVKLRPQGSKHAKEERRVSTLRETAALAQATATQAMAHATLKKSQIMEDANLFLLMTHSTDGVISECASRYLKLRQEEELDKLETRLAEARAQKANVKALPPPIPVESADVLRERVAQAMRPPTRRQTKKRSTSVVEEFDGHDGISADSEGLQVPIPYNGSNDQEGHGAQALGYSAEALGAEEEYPRWGDQPSRCNEQGFNMGFGDHVTGRQGGVMDNGGFSEQEYHDFEDLVGDAHVTGYQNESQSWDSEHEEEDNQEHDNEAGLENQYESYEGYEEDGHGEEDQHEGEAAKEYEPGSGTNNHEHGNDDEDQGPALDSSDKGVRFSGLDRGAVQQHGPHLLPATLIHSQGSPELDRERVSPSSSNPHIQRIRQGFTPPRRASSEIGTSSKSVWFQSVAQKPAIDLEDYEGTEEESNNRHTCLDLNAKFYLP